MKLKLQSLLLRVKSHHDPPLSRQESIEDRSRTIRKNVSSSTLASVETSSFKGLDGLPQAIILHIITHLSIIDIFSLKMAGSNSILTAIHKPPRLSLVNYLEEIELFRRQDMPDKTLLDIAALMGYDALVTVLLKRKPLPSIDSMLSAMVHASAHGNNSVVKFFIGSKTKILDPQFTFRHKSPIAEAAKNGNRSTVKLLLALGVSLEKSQWCSERIALIEAAEHGYEDIVKLLLTQRLTDSESWEYNSVALRLAAKAGYYGIVEELLENIGKNDLDHVAVKRRAVSIIDSQDEEGRTTLHHGVMNGHAKIVSLLLNSGANLEVQSAREHFAPSSTIYNAPVWSYSENWTALHFAAAYGKADIAMILLQHGANIDAVDSHGQTSLHLASTKGTVETVRVLLDYYPKLEAIDNVGARASHKAAASGHLDIVRLLIDQDCRINAITSRFETLLHLAVKNQHTEVAAFLIAHGLDIDAEDSSRRTPLHLSALNGDLPTTELLLSSNAYLQTKDIGGKTPLHYAARYSSRVYDLLLSHGANPDTKDRQGDTPQYVLDHGPYM
ncbi:hypothetical protein VE01_07710 [Pseudogymnoascus verrucosus]|uniref:Uncharacterized protein n=1 Tax=Pseudogymnoascus verrucosus TaxID=342668 RepID=A0A1B8GEY3_9PEZI|nr:uncharacterized protein VE01_07710 [Pseudogymnoascus verrucosus]OBT94388.2 hypothetical protein VE01_07710 [Pseudogymnoascus verrucosus]